VSPAPLSVAWLAVWSAAVLAVGLVVGPVVGGASADGSTSLVLSRPAVVRIAGGWFRMGSDEDDVRFAVDLCRRTGGTAGACERDRFADEQPAHRVYVHAFRIDRLEVSHADWRRCVRAGVCPPSRIAASDDRLGRPDHPVAGVTWREASGYCRWVGGRLPTEAEWERAARGGSRRPFPWGHDFNTRIANYGAASGEPDDTDGRFHAAPVDAFADAVSAHGLQNMAGNVWELTADHYDAKAYAARDVVDPRGPSAGERRVVRGGSWRSPAYALRAAQRGAVGEDESRPDVGVRCAYDAR